MLHFAQVLSLLNNQHYVSGEALAQHFDVTRATIHNCIARIESLGITVQRVRGLGYRLTYPQDWLNSTEIKQQLPKHLANRIVHFECLPEVDSTNRYAASLPLPKTGKFSVVLAEMQTAGKGRRGRVWVSPYAANIYLSLLWPIQRPMHEAGVLSPLLAISMLKALTELGMTGLSLKWPNDLYCNNKKLAGLLMECSGEVNGGYKMVVGMGVNVLMTQLENINIDQQWTDIVSQTPDWTHTRNDVAAELIHQAVTSLMAFEKNTYGNVANAWSRWDMMKNQKVQLRTSQSIQTGIARGIDAQGCLLLETSKGLQVISAGDVSLRANP